MKKILLDTNMLMSVGMLKVDIFSEIERICDFRHEVVTLDSVAAELEGIVKSQPARFGRAARLGLEMLGRRKIAIMKSGIMPAEAIMQLAQEHAGDIIVATQDAALKRRLRQKNIPVISLRQKKYLVMR
jgi:rRNA-processing protein FCF1